MSPYPSAPPFDGPHKQQWPHPSVPALPWSQDYSAPAGYPQDITGHANDINSRIPGLDMAAPTSFGPVPPLIMPMMNQWSNPQHPQSIPTPDRPPYANHTSMPLPSPLPAGQSHVPANNAPANSTGLNGFDIQQTTTPMDREEGEITDREDGITIANNVMHPPRSGTMASEIEEREAALSMSGSSRDSGSPYNPPISLSGDEYEPSDLMDSEMRDPPSIREDKTDLTAQSVSSTKSPAQLRVQAQGALLGLAPHNIRYNELVGEGINPTVLGRLYEEVGIKVVTPKALNATATSFQPSKQSPDQSTPAVLAPDVTEPNTAARISPSQGTAAEKSQANGATIPRQSQSEASKPLERKELIARMLASKATQSGARKCSSMPGTIAAQDKQPPSVPAAEAPPQEKDSRVKEKNKAQTELARKRMEQLKKQGLIKAQAKAQPPVSENTMPAVDAGSLPTATTYHPLPNRPPVALDDAAHLPGLFMAPTEQGQSSHHLASRNQPAPRATQRKRPRASDFDDLSTMPNKSLNQGTSCVPEERLVIDISDDEFYGDDENDVEMADMPVENQPNVVSSLISPDTHLPSQKPSSAEPYRQRLLSNSQSETSQPQRAMDDENLRKKDLAIQEMYRKIAELEQRKRPKATTSPQATRAVSTRPPGESALEASMDLSATAPTEISGKLSSSDESSSDARNILSREALSSTPSAQMLASMNESPLENVRLRLLRKKEIESGLSSLEAELLESEARLNDFKKEQEKLIAEIAQGKKGRQELADELKSLGLEINGLSFEDVEAAQRRSQSREQPLPSETVPEIEPTAASEDVPISDANAPTSTNEQDPSTQASISPAPPKVAAQTGAVEDTNGRSPPQTEPSSSSMSESEGSAMDESNDSSSVDPMPAEQGPSGEATTVPTDSRDPAGSKATDSDGPGRMEYPLPERPRSADFESQMDVLLGSVDNKETDARSESSPSDTYEPPEPEPGSSANDNAHSANLPLVAAGPGRQTDRLTEKSPNVDSTRDLPQIGILNNEPREDTARHFSAYNSPLKYFKTFRYHPDFSDEVSDGYRSLTYSHNIDLMKYLCPFEAAGGVCNDRSCEFQHFRDMNLSDDKVLIQMGSLREGKTQEEKDQYITGLKKIINHMRRDSVKDFISVAKEIVAYRRRFLQDPSRVLPL